MIHLFKTVVWEEPEQSLGPQCCKAKASFPLNYYKSREKEEYKKTEDENSEHENENRRSNVRIWRRIINCGIKSEHSPALILKQRPPRKW